MDRSDQLAYRIFKTRWGWFGLLAGDRGLLRSCLPGLDKNGTKGRLLAGIEGAKPSNNTSSTTVDDIKDYYEGSCVDFSRTTIDFQHLTAFQQAILTSLRTIKYGKTCSYGDLARLSGNPNAARAIGSVMAKNPLPLIIPCHRIIKSDGKIGLFSAEGGSETKKRMLDLEKTHF